VGGGIGVDGPVRNQERASAGIEEGARQPRERLRTTNLDLILRSTGISSLIMTGVASNNCVDCTARDGFMNDYYIVFVDDCTAATNAAIHAATLANIESLFGIVVQSEQVLREWRTIKSAPQRIGAAVSG
jgi:nicotinamidase-related amidase